MTTEPNHSDCAHGWHETRRVKRADHCPICLAPSYPKESPAGCKHLDFNAHVDVNRLTDGEGGPVTGMAADVRIVCRDCGLPMRFVGSMKVGVLGYEPTVNLMHDELRVPLTYDGAPEAWNRGPGFTMASRMHGAEEN